MFRIRSSSASLAILYLIVVNDATPALLCIFPSLLYGTAAPSSCRLDRCACHPGAKCSSRCCCSGKADRWTPSGARDDATVSSEPGEAPFLESDCTGDPSRRAFLGLKALDPHLGSDSRRSQETAVAKRCLPCPERAPDSAVVDPPGRVPI